MLLPDFEDALTPTPIAAVTVKIANGIPSNDFITPNNTLHATATTNKATQNHKNIDIDDDDDDDDDDEEEDKEEEEEEDNKDKDDMFFSGCVRMSPTTGNESTVFNC